MLRLASKGQIWGKLIPFLPDVDVDVIKKVIKHLFNMVTLKVFLVHSI